MLGKRGSGHGRGEIRIDIAQYLVGQKIGTLVSNVIEKRTNELGKNKPHICVKNKRAAGTCLALKLAAHLLGNSFYFNSLFADEVSAGGVT